MKSKNIPADIKVKSIKEAQNEIKSIISKLEESETNLKDSIDKYNRMIQLNNHIQDKFKEKLNEIRNSNFKDNQKSSFKK
jgi:exonuclease VII small subunit